MARRDPWYVRLWRYLFGRRHEPAVTAAPEEAPALTPAPAPPQVPVSTAPVVEPAYRAPAPEVAPPTPEPAMAATPAAEVPSTWTPELERHFAVHSDHPRNRRRRIEHLARSEPSFAELAKLAEQLSAPEPPPDADALRARFRELINALGRHLRRDIVSSFTIRNCGKEAERPLASRFAYRCPMLWEQLAPTDRPGERACDQCQKRVYRCTSLDEAEERARAGDCVAIDLRQKFEAEMRATGEEGSEVVGRYNWEDDWVRRVMALR